MFEGVDVDWFAIGNPSIIMHFASGGGSVPEILSTDLSQISIDILSMPVISNEILINEELASFLSFSNKEEYNHYIESFTEFAKRGLYSYDKSILNDYSDPIYHLVASPKQPLFIDKLSEHNQKTIPKISNIEFPPARINIKDIFQ